MVQALDERAGAGATTTEKEVVATAVAAGGPRKVAAVGRPPRGPRVGLSAIIRPRHLHKA